MWCVYSVVYVFKKRFTIWKQILTNFNPTPHTTLDPAVVGPLYCFILRFDKKKHQQQHFAALVFVVANENSLHYSEHIDTQRDTVV